MLEGGSLVGNEWARVLSRFFSRTACWLSEETGRSSGSRGLVSLSGLVDMFHGTGAEWGALFAGCEGKTHLAGERGRACRIVREELWRKCWLRAVSRLWRERCLRGFVAAF